MGFYEQAMREAEALEARAKALRRAARTMRRLAEKGYNGVSLSEKKYGQSYDDAKAVLQGEGVFEGLPKSSSWDWKD